MQGVITPQLNGPLPWPIVAELFRVRTGETICEDYVRTIGTKAERKLAELLETDEVVADYVPRLAMLNSTGTMKTGRSSVGTTATALTNHA